MSSSISGIVLAAGLSRRFGEETPKQLQDFRGESLVRRAARQALASHLREVIVVVGAGAEEVRNRLEGLEVRIVENPAYRDGQSTSVRAGLEAAAPEADSALFLPCDQPFLDAATLNRLIWAYERTGGGIVVPAFEGRRGAPTLFGRRYFPELLALAGDVGGRALLEGHAERVLTVALDSELPLLDADTPEELEGLRCRQPSVDDEAPDEASQKASGATVDHLVYGVPDLQAGVEEWRKLTGVTPSTGGRHPQWGTANALLSLGEATYLEIVGPDPQAPPGSRPRLFGIDSLTGGGLCGWAAAVADLEGRVEESRRRGYDPGPVATMSRQRPDGTELRWRMALPPDLQLRQGGCVPFLIDWQGAQSPAASASPGCRLVRLRGEHGEPAKVREVLAALGIELGVEEGSAEGLRATVETPRGMLLLDRNGARPVVV